MRQLLTPHSSLLPGGGAEIQPGIGNAAYIRTKGTPPTLSVYTNRRKLGKRPYNIAFTLTKQGKEGILYKCIELVVESFPI